MGGRERSPMRRNCQGASVAVHRRKEDRTKKSRKEWSGLGTERRERRATKAPGNQEGLCRAGDSTGRGLGWRPRGASGEKQNTWGVPRASGGRSNCGVGGPGPGAGKDGDGQAVGTLEMEGESQGWGSRAGQCKGTANRARGWDPGAGRTGTADGGRAGRALTFPQHEEVRLLVGVEVTEGRQGAPGLGPEEFGRDVVQRPSRDRPAAQQREPPEQRRQQRPGAGQPARRRHGRPSAPPSARAALDGSRKAARRGPGRERAGGARPGRGRGPRAFLPRSPPGAGPRALRSSRGHRARAHFRPARRATVSREGAGPAGGVDRRPRGWPQRDGGGGGAHGRSELDGPGAKGPGQALRFGWLGGSPSPAPRPGLPARAPGAGGRRGSRSEPVPACVPSESSRRTGLLPEVPPLSSLEIRSPRGCPPTLFCVCSPQKVGVGADFARGLPPQKSDGGHAPGNECPA